MKSKYFTINEMLRSQTATRFGFNEQFTPPKIIIDNLELLCANILDPLREKINKPIIISSGYRSPKTNTKVGGAKNSQHLTGQAADLESVCYNNSEIFETIKKMNLPYDQLIWEYGTEKEPAWVHVSYSINPRKQILYVGL
jgi:zinc D-Ala-D-Ala carboxypeptidase